METRKEALTFAIQNEIKAQNLYRMLSRAFQKPEVSQAFLSLVPIEKTHEEKLTALFIREFPGETPDVDKAALPGFRSKTDLSDPVKILEFACENEENARLQYTALAQHSDDPALKRLFGDLAGEEAGHKDLLQDEINRLSGIMTWFDPSELNGLMED